MKPTTTEVQPKDVPAWLLDINALPPRPSVWRRVGAFVRAAFLALKGK